MRALLSLAAGGPETLQLQQVADPLAGPGELLVTIKACSINFPDTLIIRDMYQFKPQRPFAPGGEIAGIVEAVGEGVTGFQPGDRILSLCTSGGLAEKIVVREATSFHLPDKYSFEQGASLLLTYGTSIYALRDRGHIKPGDQVLILGAAGGVGLSAIELSKAYGASVVAAVSSEEKAAAAKAAGADTVIIYGRPPFDKDQSKALAEQFKAALGPQGANIVYDIVGGEYSEPAIRAIAWEGRFLVVGFPAGIARLPLNLTLLKSCDVCGVFWGAFVGRDPARNAMFVQDLFDLWDAGKINPVISETYPLERGGEAIAKLAERGAIGKLVVQI